MPKNNWNQLGYDEQIMIIDAANRLIGLYMVKDIVETFEKINLPLLFNQPSFYNKFCPDTEEFKERIEDYRWEKN